MTGGYDGQIAETLQNILEILQAQEARVLAEIALREKQEDWQSTRNARLLITMWETTPRRKREEAHRPTETIYEIARRPLPGDDTHFKIGDKITFDGGLTWRTDPGLNSAR